MVVGTGAVRMSVPIVSAQTIKQVNFTSVVLVVSFFPTNCFANEMKNNTCINGCFLQVAPKPLTSAAVVTTTQTQQRLIMPATPLPQIQPNFSNLPPGTVLAQAPGGGNVGYAIVPAQYVTQVSVCVCFIFSLSQLYSHITILFACAWVSSVTSSNLHLWPLPAAPVSQRPLVSSHRPECPLMGKTLSIFLDFACLMYATILVFTLTALFSFLNYSDFYCLLARRLQKRHQDQGNLATAPSRNASNCECRCGFLLTSWFCTIKYKCAFSTATATALQTESSATTATAITASITWNMKQNVSKR